MKHGKKLLTLALALAMTLSLGMVSIPARAAGTTETGTITIDNAEKGKTYTAYKVFDVTYEGSNYAYSLKTKDSEGNQTALYAALTTKQAGADTDEATKLGLALNVTGDTAYVTVTEGTFSAAAFASWLNTQLSADDDFLGTGIVIDKDSAGNTTTDAARSATVTELGYYFVTTDSRALCNLTTTNPDATIHDKNIIVFDKTVDSPSADLGQKVNFTIEGKIPDYTGYKKYIYRIEDTMPNGLELVDNSIEVQVGNTKLTENTHYTLTMKGENDPKETPTFKLEFQNVVNSTSTFPIGAAVTVTYKATVTADAVGNIVENKAVLTYSSNPAISGNGDEVDPDGNPKDPGEDPENPKDPDDPNEVTTKEDKEPVYSGKITIDKYEGNGTEGEDTTKKLAGAKFVLYRMKKDATTGAATNEKEYYNLSDDGKTVTWVTMEAAATVVTTADAPTAGDTDAPAKGSAVFTGLADGTYYLHETEPPKGYNLMKEDKEVLVNDGKDKSDVTKITTDEDKSNFLAKISVTQPVPNQSGSVLPETGGIGTTIFYVMGAILALGAGVLLVARKRAKSGEEIQS